jgi:hypothetical protein
MSVGIVALALLSCNTKIQVDKPLAQMVIIYHQHTCTLQKYESNASGTNKHSTAAMYVRSPACILHGQNLKRTHRALDTKIRLVCHSRRQSRGQSDGGDPGHSLASGGRQKSRSKFAHSQSRTQARRVQHSSVTPFLLSAKTALRNICAHHSGTPFSVL